MVLNKPQQVEAIGKTKTHHAYLFPCLRECTSLPPTMLESKYHTRPYCSPSHPDYLHRKLKTTKSKQIMPINDKVETLKKRKGKRKLGLTNKVNQTEILSPAKISKSWRIMTVLNAKSYAIFPMRIQIKYHMHQFYFVN